MKGKSKPVVLPVWLCDTMGLVQFLLQIVNLNLFGVLNFLDTVNYDAEPNYRGIKQLYDDMLKELVKTDAKAAVFFITPAEIAESKAFSILRNLVSKRFDVIVYTLVAGGEFKKVPEDIDSVYNKKERRAHELGAFWIDFDQNASKEGAARVMEMIQLIMIGPDGQFPDHDEAWLRRTARQINRA